MMGILGSNDVYIYIAIYELLERGEKERLYHTEINIKAQIQRETCRYIYFLYCSVSYNACVRTSSIILGSRY